MVKASVVAGLVSGVLLLGGCAASVEDRYVGTWESVSLPSGLPADAEGVLVVEAGGSYVLSLTDGSGQTMFGQNGTWELDGEGIVAEPSDGGGAMVRGVLDGSGRLLATTEEEESAVFEKSSR